MAQKLIKDFKVGDQVEGFFVLRKKELRQRKNRADNYLALEFGDCSGRMQGSLWENAAKTEKNVEVGAVVNIKAKVISYQNKPHLNVEKIRSASSGDKVDPKNFLPVSEKDTEALLAEIQKSLLEIKNSNLLKLIHYFLDDDNFIQKFKQAPAGKLWHHACVGGLAEHTYSVMRLVEIIADHYKEDVDKEILKTAAFLHDIGKIDEFAMNGFIDYSTHGRLIGHINIAFQRVSHAILKIEKFPKKLSQQVLHCILSHHGAREKGSPVVPMTLEALILSYADELDSLVGAFQRIISRESEPGKMWSRYVNLIDRFIYLGGVEESK
ncbi:MAG: HD domain-containing protein [Calditrichaeota bacterium]|nr:HD domain-containing protein [Calditrichota bacterium]